MTMVPGLNCAQLAKGGLSTISSGPGLADWAPTEHTSPTSRIPGAATTRRNIMGDLLATDPLFGLDSSVPEFGNRSKENLARGNTYDLCIVDLHRPSGGSPTAADAHAPQGVARKNQCGASRWRSVPCLPGTSRAERRSVHEPRIPPWYRACCDLLDSC